LSFTLSAVTRWSPSWTNTSAYEVHIMGGGSQQAERRSGVPGTLRSKSREARRRCDATSTAWADSQKARRSCDVLDTLSTHDRRTARRVISIRRRRWRWRGRKVDRKKWRCYGDTSKTVIYRWCRSPTITLFRIIVIAG
jgi:hypothetical protein